MASTLSAFLAWSLDWSGEGSLPMTWNRRKEALRGTRNLRMNIMLVKVHASGVIVGRFDGWEIIGIGPGRVCHQARAQGSQPKAKTGCHDTQSRRAWLTVVAGIKIY